MVQISASQTITRETMLLIAFVWGLDIENRMMRLRQVTSAPQGKRVPSKDDEG